MLLARLRNATRYSQRYSQLYSLAKVVGTCNTTRYSLLATLLVTSNAVRNSTRYSRLYSLRPTGYSQRYSLLDITIRNATQYSLPATLLATRYFATVVSKPLVKPIQPRGSVSYMS